MTLLEPTSSDPDTLDPDLRHHYEWNLQVCDNDTAKFQFVIQADRDRRRRAGIHGLYRPPTSDAQSILVQAQPPGCLYRAQDDQAVVESKQAPAEDPAAEVPAAEVPAAEVPAAEVQGFVDTPGDLLGPAPAAPKKAPAKRAPRKRAE